MARRLEAAGYGGDCAIWIENFTSGQHWRLERMALWPEYFGEENHERAVSFGAQTRMDGLNMLTSIVMAIDPALQRHVAVPAPHRGRASRCTRVGPFTFVIGVRGSSDPNTNELPPEENDISFDVQLDNCFKWLDSHLGHDGNTSENFLRVDATLRAARFIPTFEAKVRARWDGRIPFASYAIGTPLGGHNEHELGGVAVVPGEAKTVYWSGDGSRADVTAGGGLVFLRSVSGAVDERTQALPSGFAGRHARASAAVREQHRDAARAHRRGPGRRAAPGRVLERHLRRRRGVRRAKGPFGAGGPVLSFIGSEPRNGAEVEAIAIAGSQ